MNTSTQQPDPLQLAEWLDFWSQPTAKKAAAALRRLHAENLQLRADLEAVGAGGIGPLIPATVQHQHKPSRDNDLQRENGHLITSSSTAPAGWRLVPVEPTPEMLDAGRNACEGRFYPQDMLHVPRAMMTDKWAAMLAAAPSAPAENSLTCRKQPDLQKCATPATVELTDDRIERTWQFLHDEEGNPPDQCEFARAIIAEYGSATAPQPPAPGCKATKRGDHVVCDDCKSAWDANDKNPPACVPAPPAVEQPQSAHEAEDAACRCEPTDWYPPADDDGDGSVDALARQATNPHPPCQPPAVKQPQGEQEPDAFYEWWSMRPSLTQLQAWLLWKKDQAKSEGGAA